MSQYMKDSLSRGQMSTTTGTPSAIGPEPMSWPTAPCGPGATMKSSQLVPCSANTALIAAFTCSTVRGPPPRSSSRARSIAASAARCALRIPASSASVLTRRRSSKRSASTVSSTSWSRSRSASHNGKVSGTAAAAIPSFPTARSSICARISRTSSPDARSSSMPNSSHGCSSNRFSSASRGISIEPMTMCLTPSFSA